MPTEPLIELKPPWNISATNSGLSPEGEESLNRIKKWIDPNSDFDEKLIRNITRRLLIPARIKITDLIMLETWALEKNNSQTTLWKLPPGREWMRNLNALAFRNMGKQKGLILKTIKCPDFGAVTGMRGYYTVCVTRRESEWVTEGRTRTGTRQLLTQGRILRRNQTSIEGKWAEELQDCIPLQGIKKSMLLILP